MPKQTGCKDLTPLQRLEIIAFLKVTLCDDDTHPRGTMKEAADRFRYHRNTVRDVWVTRDRLLPFIKMPTHPGRAPQFTDDEMIGLIESVPIHERTTLRSTAAGAGLNPTIVSNYPGKDKPLRRGTGRLKPALSDDHKLQRLEFVLAHVERPIGLRSRYFSAMYDTIHKNEKWFYLYKTATSYILTPNEKPPHKTTSDSPRR